MRIAERIRSQKAAIATRWEEALTRQLPRLSALERSVRIDHLPELLDGLAAWIDGDEPRAVAAFDQLAKGHALQRLSFAIDLDTLTLEYQILRSIVLREMLAIEDAADVRADLIKLNEGMDHAVLQAVRRYVSARDELRERFIGILGHDLRAPLQVVQLALARLNDTCAADPSAHKAVERGQRAVGRMDRMISDVLDFARTHLGQGIPSRPTANDMGEICRAVVDERRAAHPDRRIVVTTRGDLRGFWDRDRVAQAITNLIENAIQHGHDPIELSAVDDDRRIVTEVINPGPPIAPELLARMFEPFRRGELHGKGLGLGLYIVNAIALAHGALCDVISEPGRTRFQITWPRALPEEIPGRP
jgi:signal transduction histidine kinase